MVIIEKLRGSKNFFDLIPYGEVWLLHPSLSSIPALNNPANLIISSTDDVPNKLKIYFLTH